VVLIHYSWLGFGQPSMWRSRSIPFFRRSACCCIPGGTSGLLYCNTFSACARASANILLFHGLPFHRAHRDRTSYEMQRLMLVKQGSVAPLGLAPASSIHYQWAVAPRAHLSSQSTSRSTRRPIHQISFLRCGDIASVQTCGPRSRSDPHVNLSANSQPTMVSPMKPFGAPSR
jgi:hypothetical protein